MFGDFTEAGVGACIFLKNHWMPVARATSSLEHFTVGLWAWHGGEMGGYVTGRKVLLPHVACLLLFSRLFKTMRHVEEAKHAATAADISLTVVLQQLLI